MRNLPFNFDLIRRKPKHKCLKKNELDPKRETGVCFYALVAYCESLFVFD